MERKIYDKIINKEPILKGWSEDKKYCATTADGTKYLLRITPLARYDTRKSLFAMIEQVAALDIPMCVPVEFGTCNDGVYSIQSWINGEDLNDVLPTLSETEQYFLGLKSGEIVRKMICDVDGAKAAGLFPVCYKGAYEGYGFTPQNKCLTVYDWQELIEKLEGALC